MKVIKTLYVVSAWNGDKETAVQLTYFYAQTREEATEQGHAWRDEYHPDLQRLEVRHYPDGFHLVTSRLPGRIEETEE